MSNINNKSSYLPSRSQTIGAYLRDTAMMMICNSNWLMTATGKKAAKLLVAQVCPALKDQLRLFVRRAQCIIPTKDRARAL